MPSSNVRVKKVAAGSFKREYTADDQKDSDQKESHRISWFFPLITTFLFVNSPWDKRCLANYLYRKSVSADFKKTIIVISMAVK